jgi:hypothetical protein
MGKKLGRGAVDVGELEHAAELAGELRALELADTLESLAGLESMELAATRGARVLVLEVMQRGVTSRVALLALERALAELEAAIRELEKLEGHGVRRG